MESTDRQRRVVLRLAVATVVWLALLVGVVLWKQPAFWVQPHDRFREAQALASRKQWTDALRAVDQALAGDPDNAGYLVFKGYRELDLDAPGRAEGSFRHALRVQPSSAEASLGLAAALARQGRRDAAVSVLQTLHPDNLDAVQLRRRSQWYAMLGAYEPALQDLNQLLAKSPHDLELLQEASSMAFALQDWNRAVSLSSRLAAAASEPDLKRSALNNRAMALQASGQLEEAYEGYREAASPDKLEARAELAFRLGHYLEAAELYQSLTDQQPAEWRFHRQLAYALEAAGRRHDAERVYLMVIAEGAADEVTRVHYAWLLNTQHRYAEAWKIVAALPRPSADPDVLELQARTAVWAGVAEEAVPLLQALLRITPADAELWKLLADTFQRIGNGRSAADALRAYLRLSSQDWKARQRLADILARMGSLDEARLEYQELLAAQPDDKDILRSLALLFETSGRLDEAIPLYARATELSAMPDPELYLRLARLYRWTAQPKRALRWYERYLAVVSDPAIRRRAETELALSLLESGDPAASLARTQARATDTPLAGDELLIAARAATATGQPQLAARYLETLSQNRPLDATEQRWLADQYRAAGQPDRALALYEQILREGGQIGPGPLEAIGDLSADAGAHKRALEAYRLIPGDRPEIALKIARAAARVAEFQIAGDGYTRHLKVHPDDLEARLEAARYFSTAGQPDRALDQYQRILAQRGSAGVRLELARTHLAAGRFREAEAWARQALAAREDERQSRLALAQSLHIQGRSREADSVLRQLLRHAPGDREGLVWHGHVAVALDRHLAADRSYERAMVSGGARGEPLLLWLGNAARQRGDYAHARASYERALREGPNRTDVKAAQTELRIATAPQLEAPVTIHQDTNDLRLAQGGGALRMFLPAKKARLTLGLVTGEIRQHQFASSRTSALLQLDHLFLKPELELNLGFALDRHDRANDLVTWSAAGTYHFLNGSALSLAAHRASLLPGSDRRDLRQFNRILDLGSLGPDFHVHGIGGFVNLFTRGNQRARFDAGIEDYQDRNLRLFSYIHYQIPVSTGLRRWTVLRPNVFLETFRHRNPFYFSPERHLAVGTMLHTILHAPRWTVELEFNPQVLRTDGAMGFGGHGLADLEVRLGRVSLGAGTFIFYDGLDDYLQWRAGGRVTVLLAR